MVCAVGTEESIICARGALARSATACSVLQSGYLSSPRVSAVASSADHPLAHFPRGAAFDFSSARQWLDRLRAPSENRGKNCYILLPSIFVGILSASLTLSPSSISLHLFCAMELPRFIIIHTFFIAKVRTRRLAALAQHMSAYMNDVCGNIVFSVHLHKQALTRMYEYCY